MKVYYVPGTVLSTRDAALTRTDTNRCPSVLVGGDGCETGGRTLRRSWDGGAVPDLGAPALPGWGLSSPQVLCGCVLALCP